MWLIMRSESGSGSKVLVLDRGSRLIEPDDMFGLERINEQKLNRVRETKKRKKRGRVGSEAECKSRTKLGGGKLE